MAVLGYLNSLFPSAPKDSDASERQQEIRKGLSTSYSRGNVSLQLGRYLTSDSIQKRKKKLSARSL